MPRFCVANRKRVIVLRRLRYSLSDIKHKLEDDITIRKGCVKSFVIYKYTIKDLPRTSKTRKLSQEMSTLLDNMLKENGEMTARQIRENYTRSFRISMFPWQPQSDCERRTGGSVPTHTIAN